MFVRVRRLTLRPVRAASRTGRVVLEDELTRLVDGVLDSSFPETVARSIAEHRLLGRVAAELVDDTPSHAAAGPTIDESIERWLEREDATKLVDDVTAAVLGSPTLRRAMVEVAGSPEFRRIISEQTHGFGFEAARVLRRRATAADTAMEERLRHALRLQPRASMEFAGVVSRGAALVVDAALAQLLFLVVGASIALVASLVGTRNAAAPVRASEGTAWLLVVVGYFAVFWSACGQTPGMRLLGLRVTTSRGGEIGLLRALGRAFGLLLAVALFCTGFVPALFTKRRRALQDYLAGTVVRYSAPEDPPSSTRRFAGGAATSTRGRKTRASLRNTSTAVEGTHVHALVGGTGPPVVLLHGFAVSGAYMRPLAHLLADDFRVVVPNLPGHGARPAASVAELAELLARWLDAFALDRPIVVANSLGCQVVTETAIRRPELLGPLVLVGPSVDPARRTARHQIFNALRDSSREPSALVATAVRDAAGADLQWLLSVARSALADRIEDRLPLIPQAAVVVYGENDPFLSRAWATRAAGLLPRGRLAVVPAEGHAVHFAQPKLVADIVRELEAERQAMTAATAASHPGSPHAVGSVIPIG